ncbi:hypothetical protein PFISCL1PPCAC_3281, partial [Pristionchus fissidentatus]
YLHDVHLEILYEGFPLFPMLAGYCYGILCHWGVPILVNLGIVILIMGQMGVAIVMCIVFRHQSIILPMSPFKFSPLLILILFLDVFLYDVINFSINFFSKKR